MKAKHILYECGICSCYHPWDFGGDCRDDANRYGAPEEYEEQHKLAIGSVEVRSMEEREAADNVREGGNAGHRPGDYDSGSAYHYTDPKGWRW